jgi:hypothetical protein
MFGRRDRRGEGTEIGESKAQGPTKSEVRSPKSEVTSPTLPVLGFWVSGGGFGGGREFETAMNRIDGPAGRLKILRQIRPAVAL